jgi:hypothetical protein
MLESARGMARPRSSTMVWTAAATGLITTYTYGCGAAGNVTALAGAWSQTASKQCATFSATATTFTAPASVWFNASSAGVSLCTATVDFLATPLAYRLECANGSAYLGNLELSLSTSANPASSWFTIRQNAQTVSLAPVHPAALAGAGASAAQQLPALTQTFAFADYVGVGGCIAAPLTAYDIYGTSAEVPANSTWAAGATCFAIAAQSANVATFVSGVSTSTTVTTIQVWSAGRDAMHSLHQAAANIFQSSVLHDSALGSERGTFSKCASSLLNFNSF